MKHIIRNWVHIPGLHCGSTALRDTVTYYGYRFSEALCFGLGAGLGFFYMKAKNLNPTRIIHLRGHGMEPNFFSLINKPTQWKYEENENIALDILKEYIANDIPLLIQTDIYYLDYYRSSTHFPGHVVSVWGYDDETQTVFLADTGFEGLQPISYESLKRARTSKAQPFPLENNWFEVILDKPIPPLKDIIPEAIRKNAKSMLEGVRSPRGESSVRMIKVWSDELPEWEEASDWKWCARFAYQVIEKRGTGGGGFRWIYRDFLREAEEIIPNLKELGLSEKMDTLGHRWSELSRVLKQISESETPRSLFKKASSMAREIWELEGEFYLNVLSKLQ